MSMVKISKSKKGRRERRRKEGRKKGKKEGRVTNLNEMISQV
jgi:hypothetical protein